MRTVSPSQVCLTLQVYSARGVAMLGLVAVVMVAAGCTSRTDAERQGTSQPSPGQRIRSTASLAIDEPSPGAKVGVGRVRVRLTLTGGRVTPDTTTRLVPDEGHIHLLLDGKVISMTYGVEQNITVTQGPHVLEAEFVANDHFSFEPRVITTVTFVAQ